MRDWKKAFGQPDEKFEFHIQQTLLSIEESEEKPVKRKLSLSMALCAALAVTILVVGAFAAGTRVGGIRDDRQPLAPGSQSTASAVRRRGPKPGTYHAGMTIISCRTI